MSDFIVLIISPLTIATGNKSTALRIRSYFDRCILKDINEFKTEVDLNDFIKKNGINCIISIHAYRTGHLFQNGCIIPYIIIFAGTDLNVFSKTKKYKDFMFRSLYHAHSSITFNSYMDGLLFKTWPEFKSKKNNIIPQAIDTSSLNASLLCEPIEFGSSFSSNHSVFSLVAGLRAEKDPLFLLEAFQKWHDTIRSDVYLIVIGAQIDQSYTANFLEIINRFPSIEYIGQLEQQEVWKVMRKSVAVVNSSVTEGMCNSILEAMSLGVPVIARNNCSNEYIIEDGYNGFTFNTPSDFIMKATKLLGDDELRQDIIKNAKQHIHHHHNTEKEKFNYNKIVTNINKGDNIMNYNLNIFL